MLGGPPRHPRECSAAPAGSSLAPGFIRGGSLPCSKPRSTRLRPVPFRRCDLRARLPASVLSLRLLFSLTFEVCRSRPTPGRPEQSTSSRGWPQVRNKAAVRDRHQRLVLVVLLRNLLRLTLGRFDSASAPLQLASPALAAATRRRLRGLTTAARCRRSPAPVASRPDLMLRCGA